MKVVEPRQVLDVRNHEAQGNHGEHENRRDPMEDARNERVGRRGRDGRSRPSHNRVDHPRFPRKQCEFFDRGVVVVTPARGAKTASMSGLFPKFSHARSRAAALEVKEAMHTKTLVPDWLAGALRQSAIADSL